MAVTNIVGIALRGVLILFSVIVMGLSAKLVHDGKIYNDLLKKQYNYYNSASSFSSFSSGTDFSDLIKRDYVIGSLIYFTAPVAAYALDLAVALLTIIGGVGAIVLSTVVQGTALIFLIIDALLAVLWLAALAYSGQAFSHAGLFTALDIFQIPKADFAFVVLSFLVALALLVLSILGMIGSRKGEDGEEAPAPPTAEQPVYGDVPQYQPAGVPAAHEEHFAMPAQNEKPQQPAMNVPV